MLGELRKARKFAESMRYSGDVASTHSKGNPGGLVAIRNHFYQSGLCISKAITPVLNERLVSVYQRLQIPDAAVEAFVYSTPEIQAACATDGDGACIIRFSSALVETLSSEEFEFVAGHELGHFLLGHGTNKPKQEGLEYFMQSRAQEISADRIGLIACNSLDIAIRAMMKTISGLTSRHLRFDAGTFISQLKNHNFHSDVYTSHPSMLVRCRALLWFSTKDSTGADKYLQKNTFAELDKRIETDLRKYVDGPARKKIEKAKKNLSMWIFVLQIAEDNNFSKSEQEKFAKLFGKQTLKSMKNYLQALSAEQIRESINKRAESARQELIAIIPSTATEEISKIERSMQNKLF